MGRLWTTPCTHRWGLEPIGSNGNPPETSAIPLGGTVLSSPASLSGHLLWHGGDPEVVIELLLCWNRERCRPPLADEEVGGTAQSITRLHDRGKGRKAARSPARIPTMYNRPPARRGKGSP